MTSEQHLINKGYKYEEREWDGGHMYAYYKTLQNGIEIYFAKINGNVPLSINEIDNVEREFLSQ